MSVLSTLSNTVSLAPMLLHASWQSRRAPIAQRIKDIAPAQLAQWLSVPAERIAAVRWEDVDSGTTSRSRLLVDYTDANDPLPRSFFVKTTAATYSTRVFGNLFDLGGNELNFYRSARPLLSIAAPQIYHAEGNGADFLLLLEDLGAAGCEFADITTRCSLEQALAVTKTLADLHARFWQSPQLQSELSWLPRLENESRQRLLGILRNQASKVALSKYHEVVPVDIRAAAPMILQQYPRLEQLWASEPRTLIHGDAHIGNMYFQDGTAGLLDWQVCSVGQGMRDVSYFLVNSVPSSLRQQHQQTIIEHYIQQLASHQITLDYEQAWRQYRLHTAYTWVASVVTAAGSHMQSPKIAAAGLSRTCKAMLDLDALPLIADA